MTMENRFPAGPCKQPGGYTVRAKLLTSWTLQVVELACADTTQNHMEQFTEAPT